MSSSNHSPAADAIDKYLEMDDMECVEKSKHNAIIEMGNFDSAATINQPEIKKYNEVPDIVLQRRQRIRTVDSDESTRYYFWTTWKVISIIIIAKTTIMLTISVASIRVSWYNISRNF